MAKFRFPKNPNAERSNPFVNDEGANPFGGDEVHKEVDETKEPDGENLFRQESVGSVQPYQPSDHETFLPNRGAFVWWLGLIGCLVQLLAILVAVIAIVALGEFTEGMAYGLPGQLIGIAISLPAWIMGQSDVQAISAGAMEEGGRRATRWGLRLGAVGTMLGASQLFSFFGLLLFEGFFV